MAKTDRDNVESTPRLWETLQETPFRLTVWVHLAALTIVLLTQMLMGITQGNNTIILFGPVLVGGWIVLEATRRLKALIGLPLSALTVATALEVNQYRNAPWILLSLTAGLIAWDTYHLLRRSSTIDHIEKPREIESLHLKRLLLVVGVGSAAGIIAMLAEVNLGFGLALVLGLLAVFGVSQIVRYLRKNST
jgi:hypothetical protein